MWLIGIRNQLTRFVCVIGDVDLGWGNFFWGGGGGSARTLWKDRQIAMLLYSKTSTDVR